MKDKKLTRRDFLRMSALTAAGVALAGCAPEVVKETVEVEVTREVDVPVEQTVIVEATAVPPAAEPITIDWARHGSEGDLTTENALAEFFAERSPGVTVEPLVLPWNDYNDKIPIMVAGGTAPDHGGGWHRSRHVWLSPRPVDGDLCSKGPDLHRRVHRGRRA